MRPVLTLLLLLPFVVATSALAATPQGFALGDQPASPGYAPSAAFAYNSTGGAIRITRSAAGVYKVIFFGLGAAGAGHKSDVQVTAVESRTTCTVRSWAGSPDLTVNVDCYYIPDGSLHDSKYTVLVTFSP